VHHAPQARHVVAQPCRFWQLQGPHQHRRHDLRVADPLALYQGQELLGIEALHHHHGSAHLVHTGRPLQSRSMVERRRAEVHGRVVHAEQHALQHRDAHCGRIVDLQSGQRAANAFGSAGRPRRVQHHVTPGLVFQRLDRLQDERQLIAVEGVLGAVHHQEVRAVRNQIHHCHRGRGHLLRRDEYTRAGVVDEIGRFVGREIAVHRGEVETRSNGRPEDLVVARVVLGEDGDRVAGAQTSGVEKAGQLAGTVLELSIGDRRRRSVAHDDRRLVRYGRGVQPGVHVRPLRESRSGPPPQRDG